ncbi:MAG: HAD-IA family hydrolase [Candidatus Colwellbacteria bacterium]|nr:HAD-IA family hydrolase [Candidatus Colwellbacteria bacterium]
MIKALISDVARVLLFPKDSGYEGELNGLYKTGRGKESFNFSDYFEINTELLEFYRKLSNNLNLYIFTSDILQDAPELQKYWSGLFKDVYSASKMGTHKSKPEAYKILAGRIGLRPEEIVFVDDNLINTEAAKEAGLQTIRYLDNKTLEQDLSTLLR